MEIEDAGRNSDNSPLWVKAKAYRWYEPNLWLLLISSPSPLLRSDHRRRARLFSLILFVILVTGIIINSLATPGSQQFYALLAANICLSFAYLASRTRHYKLASSASVFLLWALTIVSVALNAMKNTYEDVTVTDPTNWLFLPALYCVCAVFLSRTGTVSVVLTDFVGCMVLPFIVNTTYFSMRKFLFFHCVMDVLLLLASIIHFRDKLQLYYSAQGISDPEAHMESRIGRLLVRPHDAVSDRILRRRTRILSLCLLILIPANILWCISEFRMNADSTVIGLSVGYLVCVLVLYAMSRSPLYKWASRATLAAFLLFPYFFSFCPSTAPEGAMFANLLANSAAAVLGIALLAGEDLVTLAAIIFFPTIYSPLFPPHVAMSIMLLAASLISRDEHEELVSAGDTAAEIPEDEDASNQKMYFGGRFTYLQAARYSFLGGFICCFILGITPLIAVMQYDGPLHVASQGSLSSEAAANYRLFVTVGRCPSELAQQYTIVGSEARLDFIYDGELVEDTINAMNVHVSPPLGDIKMVSVTLGNGDWKLGQNELCEITNVQILDVATGRAVATNLNPPPSKVAATTQSQKFVTQANNNNDGDDDRNDRCDSVQATRNSFSSAKVTCSCIEQAFSAIAKLFCLLRPCSNKGFCDLDIDDDGNRKPFCKCDRGFTGPNCQITFRDVCVVDGVIRADDGVCNDKDFPNLGQFDRFFSRDTSPLYADGCGALNSPIPSRAVSADVCARVDILEQKKGSIYQTKHNVWANAFLNFIFEDIADFKGKYTKDNSYTLPNPDSAFRIYRQPYKGGVREKDAGAKQAQCAELDCSCTSCGSSKQVMIRPRWYVNAQTSSLDGSGTYGAGKGRVALFRSASGGFLNFKFFGRYKYLDQNKDGFVDMVNGAFPLKSMFKIGDRRGNASPLSIALHTLVMSNHNRIAADLKTCLGTTNIASPLLFDAARLINVAQLHQVARELLKTFAFKDEEATRCPPKSNLIVSLETTLFMNWFDGRPEFVQTAVDCNIPQSHDALAVAFNTSFFIEQGLEKIIQGGLRQPIQFGVANKWRDFNGTKLGRPESKTDIVASLIELARDLGLNTYNEVFSAYDCEDTPGALKCGGTGDGYFDPKVCAYYQNDASKVELAVGMLFDSGKLARRVFLGTLKRLLDGDAFQPVVLQKTVGAGTVLASICTDKRLPKGLQCVKEQLQYMPEFSFWSLIHANVPNITKLQYSAFELPVAGNRDGCESYSGTIPPSTTSPTSNPSTLQPATQQPSSGGTLQPSSLAPTDAPTVAPTITPTAAPTDTPTRAPTQSPITASPSSQSPTLVPSAAPSRTPTAAPTKIPTLSPTTISPTRTPTRAPTNTPTRTPTTSSPSSRSPTLPTIAPSAAPSRAPTQQPTQTPTNIPSNVPTSNVPTALPSTAPTALPTSAPTALPSVRPSMAPTTSPTLKPAAPAIRTSKYQYDGRDNDYNDKTLDLTSPQLPALLPSVQQLSNMFGHPSNVDRGRSKLSVLAIAYARFFLSDVLEVEESQMTPSSLAGCTLSGSYMKLKSTAKNFQTPVMDLSPIFGNSDDQNSKLKNIGNRLTLTTIPRSESLGGTNDPYFMVGRTSTQLLYPSGSPNSNVDHFSNYIHSRFIHLHSKFYDLLNDGSGPEALFESARVFVVMIAETIARDLARELGILPISNFNFEKGIPKEFLLMTFLDRFPAQLPVYADVARVDDYAAANLLCAPNSMSYESTTYSIATIDNAPDADSLAWVGYSAMYTRARNGAFLSNSSRCLSNGVGALSNSNYDPIAAVIQRGRDHLFLSCEEYRLSKGLPKVSFASFGNEAFANHFATQYGGDFAKVELSVCMLLDADLRDRMMGSLILSVLTLKNSAAYCSSPGVSNFVGTPVADLVNFVNGQPNSATSLGWIAAALCRTSPKIDLRGLTQVKQLRFQADSAYISYDPTPAPSPSTKDEVDHFIACTTGNPFLAPNAEYKPQRPLLQEGSLKICDWAQRAPATVDSGLLLGNAPRCYENFVAPLGRTRRCFCSKRDGCNDHGTSTNANLCACDVGFVVQVGLVANNVMCERSSYPQTSHLDQFGSVANSVTKCSAAYNSSGLPAGENTDFFTPFCTNPICSLEGGHYLGGACNNAANADLGRVGSALGRIASANYPDGKSFSTPSGINWVSKLQSQFPTTVLTPLPNNQNALFRGMGKLLVSDVFFVGSTPVAFNESGLRTGNDASNPSQFKNLVSGWIDATPVFTAATTTTPYTASATEFAGNSVSFPATPTITDESELAMRSLFNRRYNQILTRFKTVAPCAPIPQGDQSPCLDDRMARCAREIVIQEYRVIAKEFLTEAKSLFTPKAFNVIDAVVPVELAAAQIFDLHWAPATNSCPGTAAPSPSPLDPGTFNNSPESCVNALLGVALPQQRNLANAPTPALNAISTAAERVKVLGLGSLNAYLLQLGLPTTAHPLSDNLLLDLHGSAAEYAVNFGILDQILSRDEKNSTAMTTCYEFPAPKAALGLTALNSWKTMLATEFFGPGERSFCSLYLEMQDSKYKGTTLASSQVRPNMFRTAGALGSNALGSSC